MTRIRGLWARYVHWRNTPTTARVPVAEVPVSKVDASDGDVASHVTSNVGGGQGGYA